MIKPIITSAAIAIATEAINTKISNSKTSDQQRSYNLCFSGALGGVALTPLFYAQQVQKAAIQGFPSEKTSWNAIKKYIDSNRGMHWHRYANLQGRLSWQGVLIGLVAGKMSNIQERSNRTGQGAL